MKNITISIVAVFLMICSHSSAEEGSWKGYYNCRFISDIAVEGDYLWCATSGGIIRWDTRDSTYEIYPKTEDGRVFQSFSLFVDKKGNKWASLWGHYQICYNGLGVGRFNGESWEAYSFGNYFDHVYGMAEDNDEVMWFATEEGVLSFDGDTWKTYTTEDGLLSQYVVDVAIGKDGSKWFVTGGDLSQLDGTTWTYYTRENSELKYDRINSIVFDNEGVLWIRERYNLQSFDGTTWNTYPYGYSSLFTKQSIAVDENNVKWINCSDGVRSFDGTTWTHYTNENSGLADNDVSCCTAGEGKVWFVSSPDGYSPVISEFDGTTWKNYELKEEQIHTPWKVGIIFVDHTNAKWIYGQYDGGLKYFDGLSWCSRRRETHISSYIFSIAEDHDDVMWFGTFEGLARLEGEDLTFYNNENSELPPHDVVSVFIDHNNFLWASTNSGLCMYNGSAWKIFTPENSGLPDNFVPKIDEDQNGVMWFIASYPFNSPRCVCSFDGTEWKIYNTENTEIENFYVNCIFIDKNNVKWFATSGGITSFDDTKWKNYNTLNSGLVYDDIKAVLVDSRGNLWAGFPGGISRFDGNTWTTYTKENSLLLFSEYDNRVYDIVEDHDGVIWIGTCYGIASYDPGTSTFVAQKEIQPELVSIQGAYPNPFNSSTTISFALPASGFTQLVIYNITGQKVREVLSETMTAGIHNVVWDGRDNNGNAVSSGMYISRLYNREQVTHSRMVLMK